MKYFISALCVIIAFILLTCGKSKSDVAGTWITVEHYVSGELQKDISSTVTLYPDGTAVTQIGRGTFDIDGDKIYFISENDYKLTFTIDDDKLIMESPAIKTVFKREKR